MSRRRPRSARGKERPSDEVLGSDIKCYVEKHYPEPIFQPIRSNCGSSGSASDGPCQSNSCSVGWIGGKRTRTQLLGGRSDCELEADRR